MGAARRDIDILENSQFDFYVKKRDSSCTPTDVTGYGAKFQVRETREATGQLLYEATVGNGITVQPSGETGLFHVQLTVPEVNSPQREWEKAYYDLVIWPPGGSIVDGAKRLVQGRATWGPAATHP